MNDEIREEMDKLLLQDLRDAQDMEHGSEDRKSCSNEIKMLVEARNTSDEIQSKIYDDGVKTDNEKTKTLIENGVKILGYAVKAGLTCLVLFANIRGFWYPKDPLQMSDKIF